MTDDFVTLSDNTGSTAKLDYDKLLHDREVRIGELEAELRDIKDVLKNETLEGRKLMAEKQTLDRQFSEMTAIADDYEKRLKSMSDTTTNLNMMNDRHGVHIIKLESELGDVKRKNEELTKQLDLKKILLKGSEMDINDLSAKVNEYEVQLTEKENLINKQREEKEGLSVSLVESEKVRLAYECTLAVRDELVKNLQNKNADLSARVASYECTSADKDEAIVRLRKELLAMEDQYNAEHDSLKRCSHDLMNMAELVQKMRKENDDLREEFVALRVSEKEIHDDLNEKLALYERQLADKDQTISEQSIRIELAEGKLVLADGSIELMNDGLEDMHVRLEDMYVRLHRSEASQKELSEKVVEYERQLADKDTTIKELTKDLNVARENIDELDADGNTQDNRIEQLLDDLQKKTQQADNLAKEVQEYKCEMRARENTIHDQTKRIEYLNKKLTKARDLERFLNTKLDEKSARDAGLVDELQKQRELCTELSCIIETLKDELAKKKEQIEKLEIGEVDKKSNTIAAMQKQLNEECAENNRLRSAMANLANTMFTLERQIEDAHASNAKITDNVAQMADKELLSKRAEIDRKDKIIEGLQKDLNDAFDELEDFHNEVKALRGDYDYMTDDNLELQAKCRKLQNENENLQQTVDMLKQALKEESDLSKDIARIADNQLNAQDQEIMKKDGIIAEDKAIIKDLYESLTEEQELSRELAMALRNENQLLEEYDALMSEINQLTGERETAMVAVMCEMRDTNKELEQERENLQVEIKDLHYDVNILNSRIDYHKSMNESMTGDLNQYQVGFGTLMLIFLILQFGIIGIFVYFMVNETEMFVPMLIMILLGIADLCILYLIPEKVMTGQPRLS